jgi:hypothetical protein
MCLIIYIYIYTHILIFSLIFYKIEIYCGFLLQLDPVALTGQGWRPAPPPAGHPAQIRERHGEKGLAESLLGGKATNALSKKGSLWKLGNITGEQWRDKQPMPKYDGG